MSLSKLLPLGAFSLVIVLGCGGDKSKETAAAPVAEPTAPPAQPQPKTEPTPPPAPAVALATPDAGGVVHLTANDLMQYNANRIEVPVGKKVKVELKNIGVQPKEAMGHDFIALKAGTDVMAFGMKAINAKATDYIPQDALGDIIAHTKLLGPGETDLIEFDLPGAGTYPFLCSFPGHVALMKGVIVAQ